MTCQECELGLASEDRSDLIDRHLAGCAACREFALELRVNGEVLGSFAREPMPALPQGLVIARPLRQQVAWWAAVAAVLVLGFVSSWAIMRTHRPSPHFLPLSLAPAQIAGSGGAQAVPFHARQAETPAPRRTGAAPVRHRAPKSWQESEPHILQVKMLTDDPDVVIYWQIEN
jgi:hypothetical protein